MNSSNFASIDRRGLLSAAGLSLLPGVVDALARPGSTPDVPDSSDLKDPWMRDPEKSFINFLRSQGDLSGLISPQWWRGAYLAIYTGRQPELLFRMEGCEMKRLVDLGNGEYQFQYKIFTSIKHKYRRFKRPAGEPEHSR